MRQALLLFLIIASGFVASGFIASLYRALSGRSEYALEPKTDAGRLAAVGLTIFTGPAVLTFNALKADPAQQPRAYLFVILSLCAAWSYLLGLFVMTIAIRIPFPF